MNLDDRMKEYERVSSPRLLRRMPVIIRIDGRSFHTFTRKAVKPFDKKIIQSMVESALDVSRDAQGFKMGYVQSDEASFLLTDYDSFETEAWFGNKLNKLVSISASIMTASFNRSYFDGDFSLAQKLAHFDSRAFNVPENEVVNYFLGRALDWKRNSLSMLAQSKFSCKELHGKDQSAMNDMLHGIGVDWSDLDIQYRNGTFLVNTPDGVITKSDIKPSFADISALFNLILGEKNV